MINLEAKFRLPDLERAAEVAQAIGYARRATLIQRDTFFRVVQGKLKLREENGNARLIFYGRTQSGPLMLSNYEIEPVANGPRMRRMLTEALGTLAVVEKVRVLMTRDNVRLHLDRVTALGNYGEIEAVVADGDDPERSRDAVDELLGALGIAKSELIDVSYFEMLART